MKPTYCRASTSSIYAKHSRMQQPTGGPSEGTMRLPASSSRRRPVWRGPRTSPSPARQRNPGPLASELDGDGWLTWLGDCPIRMLRSVHGRLRSSEIQYVGNNEALACIEKGGRATIVSTPGGLKPSSVAMRTSSGDSRQRHAACAQAWSIVTLPAIDLLEPSLNAKDRLFGKPVGTMTKSSSPDGRRAGSIGFARQEASCRTTRTTEVPTRVPLAHADG
jgi:hypothetical protein